MIVWSILLNVWGCDQPVPRQIPFEYEITDSILTVYEPNVAAILYYAPEVFATGWGEYDWDAYNQGAWCPDAFGEKRIVVELDERDVIRLLGVDFDFIIDLKELRDEAQSR